MSVPITYLELLQNKVIPNTQEDIRIRFDKEQKLPDSISEDKDEKLIQETPSRPRQIAILDKRRSSTVNRDIIMDKLRKQDAFAVKPKPSTVKTDILVPKDIPTPEIIEEAPIKIDKEVILSEVVPIEEEKEEKEEDDDIFDVPVAASKGDTMEDIKEKETITQLTELKTPAKFEEEVQEEKVEEIIKPKKRGRPKKIILTDKEEAVDVDLTTAVIRTQKVADRLPKEREKNIIVAPPYYMNNRKLFIQKLNKILQPREQELLEKTEEVSCDRKSGSDDFSLLSHQRIVRDYLNLYTPYRGLLLYHGLGSGKTCTSIAIAEGMKSNRKVFVLTPASLKMNFFSEMKKCGDELYKKNQFWEFVSIEGNPEYLSVLSKALSLPLDYIRKNRGAWLVNINKEPNFSNLSTDEKESVDLQLNEMIRSKYTDINYNGMNMNKLNKLTDNQTRNPFDNSVVIIDEAHNFVSRIVNKIKQKKSISYILYDYLMNATNARIVLLSGTPIINYPNEIGILYNILRGYIKTWTMNVTVNTSIKVDTNSILNMFDKAGLKTHDFVEYSGNKLIITRNPYGFINTKKRGALKGTQREKPVNDKAKTRKVKGGAADDSFNRYDGVKLDDSGNLTDADFLKKVLAILKKNGLEVQEKTIEIKLNKCLPDSSEEFIETFVNQDTEQAKNINLFQRRILGLTSYYRSAQENLLPSLVKTEEGDDYNVVYNEMSDHQFGIYTKIRKEEADREKAAKKQRRKQANKDNKEELFNISSTYRIFSRAACNFVFPDEIERPIPTKDVEKMDENDMDVVSKEAIIETDPYSNVDDEEKNQVDIENYAKRIENALVKLNAIDSDTGKHKYLTGEMLQHLSPKFLQILENLTNPENIGLHLIYSHFRTMEGIGILRLILLANGYAEFKIKKMGDDWDIVEDENDKGKPKFVLYTGTETTEEKEIIRNVYNGAWDFVPVNIAYKLREQHENNMYGEVIKIFMITSSGAEGINLKNTRYVHIVEPYWHMVRPDQVVGRARRICSHQDLPEELRTVQVYLYVTTLSDEQKTDDKNIELRIRDVSRLDENIPVTTDETLYEIASIKQRINNQILQGVKETAIDCNIYARTAKSDDKPMVCYGYGKIESNTFSSYPSFEMDKRQKEGLDVAKLQWDVQEVNIQGNKYALRKETMELYDYESYNNALNNPNVEPKRIGKLVKEQGQFKIIE
jgi:hypothetical protein